MATYNEIGTVAGLFRFPVKSMGGEELDTAHLGWHGIEGDRRFAFLRRGEASGLPWLSARECPGLIAYGAHFENPDDSRRSALLVELPDGRQVDVRADALRQAVEDEHGGPLDLIQLWRGAFDAMSVSLITSTAIASIEKVVERSLEPERFRANILIATEAPRPYPEEKWVSRTIVFGDRPDAARVRINRRDPRCSVVNVNPRSGITDIALHGAIVRERKNQLGVYGQTEWPGTIAVGDSVLLKSD